MTDIRFYHLQKQSLDQALPQILKKALAGGHKVVVQMPSAAEVERMNGHLWTYHPNEFLPHGSQKDGHAESQHIWLSDKEENPNEADVLILTGGSTSEKLSDYKLVCEMLNGHDDEQIKAARCRWKTYGDTGYNITYWKQTEKGGWEEKGN